MMKGFAFLAIAIVSEVIATSSLKASDGFSRIIPSIITVVGYMISFYFLSLTLRVVPVGIAYSIWSGLGIVAISLVAYIMFGQKLDPPALVGIAFIVAGVLVISLMSSSLR